MRTIWGGMDYSLLKWYISFVVILKGNFWISSQELFPRALDLVGPCHGFFSLWNFWGTVRRIGGIDPDPMAPIKSRTRVLLDTRAWDTVRMLSLGLEAIIISIWLEVKSWDVWSTSEVLKCFILNHVVPHTQISSVGSKVEVRSAKTLLCVTSSLIHISLPCEFYLWITRVEGL